MESQLFHLYRFGREKEKMEAIEAYGSHLLDTEGWLPNGPQSSDPLMEWYAISWQLMREYAHLRGQW